MTGHGAGGCCSDRTQVPVRDPRLDGTTDRTSDARQQRGGARERGDREGDSTALVKFDEEGFLAAFGVSRKGAVGEALPTRLVNDMHHTDGRVHAQDADAQPQDGDCPGDNVLGRRPYVQSSPTVHVPAQQRPCGLFESICTGANLATALKMAVSVRKVASPCGANLAVAETGAAQLLGLVARQNPVIHDSIVSRNSGTSAHRHDPRTQRHGRTYEAARDGCLDS